MGCKSGALEFFLAQSSRLESQVLFEYENKRLECLLLVDETIGFLWIYESTQTISGNDQISIHSLPIHQYYSSTILVQVNDLMLEENLYTFVCSL
jgi:hypothetical protein